MDLWIPFYKHPCRRHIFRGLRVQSSLGIDAGGQAKQTQEVEQEPSIKPSPDLPDRLAETTRFGVGPGEIFLQKETGNNMQPLRGDSG